MSGGVSGKTHPGKRKRRSNGEGEELFHGDDPETWFGGNGAKRQRCSIGQTCERRDAAYTVVTTWGLNQQGKDWSLINLSIV